MAAYSSAENLLLKRGKEEGVSGYKPTGSPSSTGPRIMTFWDNWRRLNVSEK